ncbi:Nitrogen permease regulator 3 [Pseudozyma hubeiensis]|nr:Nitrogen permease regulator 3 [Pseudozyma hubeiensis]
MTEPLLGVILATSSSRGDQIVFRWPNNPKLSKRYSKVKYFTDARPSQVKRNQLDDELDPVRQKAKWDHHDEDDDDNANRQSDDAGQSDTPSSSDVEDSDGTMADEDENRSVRDRAETVASHGRSKIGAATSASRSKSKTRRPLLSMEEATHSVRSHDRQTGAHKDATDAHDKAPDSDAGTSKELSPEEKAKREERAARAYKTYLGYDIDILASILNPRTALAHQKFELVVDDLAFLGHPVAAHPESGWDEEGGEPHQTDSDAQGDKSTAQSQQRGRSGLRKEIRPFDLPDGGDGSHDETQDSTSNGVKSRHASRTRVEKPDDASASRSKAPLTQFHLVLVLDRPDPSTALPTMDLSAWLQLFYDNIVFKMTAALFAEQQRVDYVGRETEKLLALRERCMDDGQAYAAYAAQCLGISSLARCIRDLYKCISTSSDAFLTVNDSIEVHTQLPPILQDPTNLHKMVDIETELDSNDPIFLSGGGFAGRGKENAQEDGTGGTYDRLLAMTPAQLSFEEWCRTTGPYLLPWKTLLLLHDQVDDGITPPVMASSGPAGLASPGGGAVQPHDGDGGFERLTRNFKSLFVPSLYNSLNFGNVADMFEWNLYDDVYPMVRHLLYYKQARVIDVPRPGHVYAISPLFDFARLGPLSHVWAQTFPDLAPLPVFLSQLSSSTSRTLSNLLPARHQKELALDVLVWLLRRDVVVKMHVRLRLVATESVKRRTSERRRERHDRHRARKEKKRQRAAKLEAKRMRKSQAEEQQRRKAAEKAARAEALEQEQQPGLSEERGRSRERETSNDVGGPDTARASGKGLAVESEATEASADGPTQEDTQTSGLSVSRPPILADPDSVAEAAAVAAAIAGSGEERRQDSQEHGRQPRHHHHHHHHHHHRHHQRRQQHASDANAGSDSTAAVSDKAPIPIAPRPKFDELKFERRPVLRSRSPSTAMMAAGGSTGLSVSFSNLSDRGELIRRARADTTGSSSSGGGLTRSRTRGEGISMTPTTSQQSRPSTPNVVGRNIPSHIRDRSTGGDRSNMSSSAEGGSVPRRARRATSSAGWGGRKGVARSRSPSRARMRVKGFGAGAEVEIDDDGEDEGEDEAKELMTMDEDVKQRAVLRTADEVGASQLAAKLNALQVDKEGKTTKRRISTASERPDIPPPSESNNSDGVGDHSSRCGCSKHNSTHSSSSSSSSSSDMSSSDLSLSSDLESDPSASESDSHIRKHRPSPNSSSSLSPTSSPNLAHSRPHHSRHSTFSRTTSAHATPAVDASSSTYTDSLIVEPARASRRENEYIATMVENKDANTTKLFFRLLPYLNGKHTIDEIEYRVGMRRRDIRRLLKTFREFIVTFMHP